MPRDNQHTLRWTLVLIFGLGGFATTPLLWAGGSFPSRPTTPVVTDDGTATVSTSQLHAGWSSSDLFSRITEYQFLIRQDAPSAGTVIVDWTSTGTATVVTRAGLALQIGKTYYVGVKAKNSLGRWSSVGYSDGITVVINRPPLIQVGPDQTAQTGGLVRLDGSGTRDPEEDPLSYAWQQTAGPAVSLSNPDGATATFTAPPLAHDAALNFTLTVSDGLNASRGTTAVTVQQAPPPTVSLVVSAQTATAGQPFTITVGGTSPAGLAAVWWFGAQTGVSDAVVTLDYPPAPTSDQAFTTPVVNPTKLDRAFGSPLFSAAQAVTSYSFNAAVVINQPGTYSFGANSRDVFYAVPGEAHQASEGSGIPSVTVTVQPAVPPPAGAITIHDGADFVNTPSVNLQLSATGGQGAVTQMRFCNEALASCGWSAPEPYAPAKSGWMLSAGDGLKTVNAQFQDAAGSWSAPVADTIILDMTNPSVQITSPPDGAVITDF